MSFLSSLPPCDICGFFITGIIIGFLVAAIIGPIGILVVRRSVADGFLIGLVSGLGVALADTVYSGLATFGLTIVADYLLTHTFLLRLVGGIYLTYLGIRIFFTRPRNLHDGHKQMSILNAFTSIFFLTLTNPLTIALFAALFSTAHIDVREITFSAAAKLTCGIFIGSTIWWLILTSISSFFGSKLTVNTLSLINKITGSIIVLVGLVNLIALLLIR